MNKFILLITSLCVVGVSCSTHAIKDDQEKKPSDSVTAVTLRDDQVKNAGIEIGSATIREMNTTLQVNGIIEVPPGQMISLSVPLGGYVKSMNLLPGTKVRQGEFLLSLEDPQYIQLQQDYLTAKARLEFIASDYERQRELNRDKTNSDKVFQQAKSEFTSQKVLLKSLAEKLRLLNINPDGLDEESLSRSIVIYSPISGYVSSINVNTGKYVAPTDVILELVDPRNAHLSLTVFERDIASIHPGQEVICFANANPGQVMKGNVQLVNQRISNERTIEVHCDLDNTAGLLPGTFMNAAIQVTNMKVPAVPDEAIVIWQNKPFVFAASPGNTFIMTPVETGIASNGFTELKTTLPNPQIAIKNAYSLLMQLRNNGE